MKARLLTNELQSGHIARDFIHLALGHHNSTPRGATPVGKAAHVLLESFEDHDRPHLPEPVIPIKRLVKVMTEGLQGMPNLSVDGEGRIEGAKLYRGCKVRLRGIPERRFIIYEIYWDYEEVRVR